MKLARIIPGLALAVVVMLMANPIATFLGRQLLQLQGLEPEGRGSPVSSILIAILLGIAISNLLRLPEGLKPGLTFAVKKVLRFGIICIGIRLSLIEIVKTGLYGIPIVATVIIVAIALTPLIARRLGVSDRLATLTAAATAICGVTAAVAVAPVIDAEDEEVTYAIANVTLFGSLAMFCYPYLAHLVFGRTGTAAGIFLGTSIHDTAQVIGAALSYRELFHDDVAFKVATVTKLTRNLFLVAVIPILGVLYARRQGREPGVMTIAKYFPLFVLGFVAMAMIRSVGDATLEGSTRAFGLLDAATWKQITTSVGERLSSLALGTAMAAVGLTTHLSSFRLLGLRPLYLGATMALIVGVLGLALAAVYVAVGV